MNGNFSRLLLFLSFCCLAGPGAGGASAGAPGGPLINHRLFVSLDPASGRIEAVDTLTIPAAFLKGGSVRFKLISRLEASCETPGARLEKTGRSLAAEDSGMDRERIDRVAAVELDGYELRFRKPPAGDAVAVIRFSGKIDYPVEQAAGEYARSFSETPGIICEQGVYLAGSTVWAPKFGEELITFEMTVSLPEGWDAVSQGSRTEHGLRGGRMIARWESPEPMEEIFLIAARFHEYSSRAGKVDVIAFLRTPDEALAGKYLETTSQYLDMYRGLIGPYPFTKFALVENFWETGYGMPSFTLLGEKVIRFPFILHSSYPHELLHNWWGNSVYVDFGGGNWCEGLTTYMADHLIKEQRAQGAQYRRDALQRYADYVGPDSDFPLKSFISRTDAATEAVGYGKSMMMWHMLRRMIGDRPFIEGVKSFYRDNIYRAASFGDLRAAFERSSGIDLGGFFEQWVERAGAPELRLSNVAARGGAGGYELGLTLAQVQKGEPYSLQVAAAVSFRDSVAVRALSMNGAERDYRFEFREMPLSVRMDPEFDLFRRLDPEEIPPSLSGAFGAERVAVILPSADGDPMMEGYRAIADAWAGDSTLGVLVVDDDAIETLPAGMPAWILGRGNRFRNLIEEGLRGYDASVAGDSLRFGSTSLGFEGNSAVVSVRHPGGPGSVLVWLTIGDPDAVPGLLAKLPHYGKYGHLVFEGAEPVNIVKGQWEAVNSPMVSPVRYDAGDGFSIEAGILGRAGGKSGLGAPVEKGLPPRKPLADLPPVFSAASMMKDIAFLAGPECGGRAPGTEGIEKAAGHIARRFAEAGLEPGGDDGTFFQSWEGAVDGKGTVGRLVNVIGVLPGAKKGLEDASAVICAHYDHLGLGWPDVHPGDEGKVHPGADDNASGVAVMIELASRLAGTVKPARNIVFAAFTAEESGLRGSRRYISSSKRFPPQRCIGAINLDTVGRLGERKVLVLGTPGAREWRHIFMGSGYVTGVEAEMPTLELDSSDQVSFTEAGIPAVQIFTGPHGDYHRPGDTADKIDAQGMVKVASLAREALIYLADREEPLEFSGPPAARDGAGELRKAGTGCMPDFSWSGKGVRVASVTPGSSAEKAGILPGDVIISLGGSEVSSLKEYSEILKSFSPGDETEIAVLRGAEEKRMKIVLGAR